MTTAGAGRFGPIAHSDQNGGSWMPTRHAHIVAMAQTPEIFTSREVGVIERSPESREGPYGGVGVPPIDSNPPEHHGHRRAILPTFAPQAVAKYESITCDLCNRLIDGFIDNGSADAASDYAQRIPVRVISMILGVPFEMEDDFVDWVRGVLETGLIDREVALQSRMKIITFFMQQIEDRRANPRDDDLISDLLRLEIDGQPVNDIFVLGACNLMLIAGIDTTWSAIGSSLWHLAHRADHRHQLATGPTSGRPGWKNSFGSTPRSPWRASSRTTQSSKAVRCTPATVCSWRSRRRTATRACSRAPIRCSSIARTIVMWHSVPASTAVPGRTSPDSNFGWRYRSGWNASQSSSSSIPPTSHGRAARSAAPDAAWFTSERVDLPTSQPYKTNKLQSTINSIVKSSQGQIAVSPSRVA